MGITINLAVARAVTQREWEQVYKEALKLTQKMPVGDIREADIRGIPMRCVAHADEVERKAWGDEVFYGISIDGDLERMRYGENYFLPRVLGESEPPQGACGNALMGILPAYTSHDWDAPDVRHATHDLWGAKTQGEPYHLNILALGCLIQDRLGEKAFVWGNITRWQCEQAVAIANRCLDVPVALPDQCDAKRLFKRIRSLPVDEQEKIGLFMGLYLEDISPEYGTFLTEHFQADDLAAYWNGRFQYEPGTNGYSRAIHDYLSMGYDLAELCSFAGPEKGEAEEKYKEFIACILETKMHIREKDVFDPIRGGQHIASLGSVAQQFAQALCGGLSNHAVDRYIPMEDLRAQLKAGLGEACDVDGIMDACLADAGNKEDVGALFREGFRATEKELVANRRAYDISQTEDVPFYSPGDTMLPVLETALAKNYRLYHGMLEEEQYAALMEQSADDRCRFLAIQNRYLLLKDSDWERILNDIHDDKESFARYYPAVRVEIGNEDIDAVIRAFILNDALYARAAELSEQIGEEDEDDEEDNDTGAKRT